MTLIATANDRFGVSWFTKVNSVRIVKNFKISNKVISVIFAFLDSIPISSDFHTPIFAFSGLDAYSDASFLGRKTWTEREDIRTPCF